MDHYFFLCGWAWNTVSIFGPELMPYKSSFDTVCRIFTYTVGPIDLPWPAEAISALSLVALFIHVFMNSLDINNKKNSSKP